jgi:hypothetical protein
MLFRLPLPRRDFVRWEWCAVRAELVDLRVGSEKLGGVVWANEPAASYEESLLEVATIRARLDAAECEILAAYDASKEYKATGDTSAAARISHLTRTRKGGVDRRCRLGRALRAMPHTKAAFETGQIGLDHVDVLANANRPALAVRFAIDEELLVGYALALPFGEFRRQVNVWVDVIAPDDAEQRALSQHEARDAHSSSTFERMGRVDAWLDPMGFHEFDTELDRRYQILWEQDWADARARLGDHATSRDLGRTAGQRRADALVAMARASAAHGSAGAAPNLGTTVVCDHDTHLTAWARLLAELDGQDPDQFPYPLQRRCAFADGTPVTPYQALFTSITGWLNTLVLDENGYPLSFGRERRWFTRPQARASKIAFPVCKHETCTIDSPHCEIDHILAAIDGGNTDSTNAQPLCKAHNLWKEHVRARDRRRGVSPPPDREPPP